MALFMAEKDIRLEVRDKAWYDFIRRGFDIEQRSDPNGGTYYVFKVSPGASDYEVYKWLTASVRQSSAFKDWVKENRLESPAPHSAVTPAPGSPEYARWVAAERDRTRQALWESMREAGATDSEVFANKFWTYANDHLGPGGTADEVLMALSPLAARNQALADQSVSRAKVLARTPKPKPTDRNAIEPHHQLPREFEQRFSEVGLDIEDYVVPVPKGKHRLKPGGLHTKDGGNWNKVWREYLEENQKASPQEILEKLAQMRREFGLE